MNEKEFDRLLSICRIKLTEEERKGIKADVEEVIKYFDAIAHIDCDGESEAYHPIRIPPKLREDKVEAFEDADLLLKNTRTHRFYVIGPRI